MIDTATDKKIERMAPQLRFVLLDILGIGKGGQCPPYIDQRKESLWQ